jgi:hypothetical protein
MTAPLRARLRSAQDARNARRRGLRASARIGVEAPRHKRHHSRNVLWLVFRAQRSAPAGRGDRRSGEVRGVSLVAVETLQQPCTRPMARRPRVAPGDAQSLPTEGRKPRNFKGLPDPPTGREPTYKSPWSSLTRMPGGACRPLHRCAASASRAHRVVGQDLEDGGREIARFHVATRARNRRATGPRPDQQRPDPRWPVGTASGLSRDEP